MATVNIDEILYQFIEDGLNSDYPMLFQFLQMVEGWMAIVPIPSDETITYYIDGGKHIQYDFMLQIALNTSIDPSSEINTDNMLNLRQWQDWIESQELNGNYPDFGIKYYGYEWVNLSNMPMMAGRQDDGMAKYQFSARLIYDMEV